jgi:hypothetical protein
MADKKAAPQSNTNGLKTLIETLAVATPIALFNSFEKMSQQALEAIRADHKAAVNFGESLQAAAPDQILNAWNEAGRAYVQDVTTRNVALARKNVEQTQEMAKNLAQDVTGAWRALVPSLAV